jgi:hypothetical protein
MFENWESEIAGLLTELADVQGELLDLLDEKRQLLVRGEHDSLAAIADREEQLARRLQACQNRRQHLLTRAAGEGLPSDSIRALNSSMPAACRGRMQAEIAQAAERSRLLQHQCLTNWVLVQRTLLHLSQMVEIIATGGRPLPTYGNGADRTYGGALVDRHV